MKKYSLQRKMLSAAVTAAVLVFGAATSAHANLWLAYSGTDGTNNFAGVCQDGAACDTNLLTGVIALNPATLINPLPGLIITNLGSTSTISPGPGGVNTLLGGSLIASYGALTNVVAPIAGSVTIHTAFGDVNYVGPSTAWTTTGSGTWGVVGGVGSSTLGSSSLMSFYNDPANSQGADVNALDRPGNLVNSVNNLATGNILDSFAFTNNGLLAFPDGALYSMTLGTDFVIVAGASLASQGQGIAKSTTVPEPGSMLLLGTALAGLGFTRRRKAE